MQRPGHRHPRGRPRPHLRALLPGGRRPGRTLGRHRPGPGHRAPRRRQPRGQGAGGVRRGRGLHLRPAPPAGPPLAAPVASNRPRPADPSPGPTMGPWRAPPRTPAGSRCAGRPAAPPTAVALLPAGRRPHPGRGRRHARHHGAGRLAVLLDLAPGGAGPGGPLPAAHHGAVRSGGAPAVAGARPQPGRPAGADHRRPASRAIVCLSMATHLEASCCSPRPSPSSSCPRPTWSPRAPWCPPPSRGRASWWRPIPGWPCSRCWPGSSPPSPASSSSRSGSWARPGWCAWRRWPSRRRRSPGSAWPGRRPARTA